MSLNYILAVLISFSAGIVFLVLFKKFSLKTNLFLVKGIPFVGGISIGLSFILSCLFLLSAHNGLPRHIVGVLVSSLIMLIFGIIDDFRELSVSAKLFVQVVATSLLILFGIKVNIAYIGGLLNIIITFCWVIGITNAFNLLDIMDGLAAGIALIVCLAFSAICFLNGDHNTLILVLVLAGVLAGFLIYNLPPAKIYMGNSGSHFLGFVLAGIAMMISYASLEKKIALLSPLLILGLPILDTIFLILIRISKKRFPFEKTNDHIALRFLALGYSKRRTLLTVLGFGMFFSLCGVLISRVPWPQAAAILALAVLSGIFLANKISKVVIYG